MAMAAERKDVDNPAGGENASGPLSIMHIVAPARFGGLESVLRGLARGQTRAGDNVLVTLILSPGDEEHPFARSLEGDGVAIAQINIGDRNYFGERRAVREIVGRHLPDVVHTHGFRPDVVDGAVARSKGIATVSTCHGFIDAGRRGRFYQWLQRRALRHFDAVIAVSETIARRVAGAGVARSRVHFVPNAFSPAEPSLTKAEARRILDLPDVPIIGWVGRLSHEKGPDVAIDAFARFARPTARLVILGAGPNEAELRQRATALGLADRILWRGAVPDAGRLFSAFDAFLLSSRTEGTPVALLEAMAAEVPVVATLVGGIPDIVNPASARLVESGDIPGIADALAETLNSPDEARARARRARAMLDAKFGMGRWLARYDSIYRSVVRPALRRASPETFA